MNIKMLLALGLVMILRAVAAEPWVVDENALLQEFVPKMGEWTDAGELRSGEALAKELKSRPRCQLQLPEIKRAAPKSLYEEMSRSVFVLSSIYKCDHCDRWHRSGGATTWALTEDGVMVTNYHVFDSKKQAAFGVIDRDGKVYPVEEILAGSELSDIAIFRVKGKGFRPLGLRPDAEVGTPVWLISHPAERYYFMSQGMVARYFRFLAGNKDRGAWMQVTLDYAKGSSGGPVFDVQGRVVSMVSSTHSIYYGDGPKETQTPLQMVVKNTPTARAILELIEEKP